MELIDMVPESDSNNLREIENIKHEYCTDQTQILPEFVFKVITIGDPGSGKSSLLKRLIENKFIEGKITIGVEYNSFAIKVQNKQVKLGIWDTAGEENFRSVTKIFFRNTHAVILCYPINSKKSFDNIQYWMNEIYNQCSEDVLIFLVGNKADLEQQRQVTQEQAREFQKQNDLLYYCESSALDGTNIQNLFTHMSKFLYLKFHEVMEEARAVSYIGGRSNLTASMISDDRSRGPSITSEQMSVGHFGPNEPRDNLQPNNGERQTKVKKKKEGCC